MVRVVAIDHIALRVSDLARSKAFYDGLLGFMGFVREWEFGEVVGWNNWETMVWITQADQAGPRSSAPRRQHRLSSLCLRARKRGAGG